MVTGTGSRPDQQSASDQPSTDSKMARDIVKALCADALVEARHADKLAESIANGTVTEEDWRQIARALGTQPRQGGPV